MCFSTRPIGSVGTEYMRGRLTRPALRTPAVASAHSYLQSPQGPSCDCQSASPQPPIRKPSAQRVPPAGAAVGEAVPLAQSWGRTTQIAMLRG